MKENEILADEREIYTVDVASVGTRIDIYAAEREEISRSVSQKLIEDGGITVNGEATTKNYRLRLGDRVEIDIPEPVPYEAQAEDIPLDIVYEDSSLIVVNKPKGMVVHPAAGNYTGTLVNALLYHCGDSLSGINGVVRPGIVHRIDKDTSGLLVVAKGDRAHLSLASQIKAHSFERLYNAVTVGALPEDSGRIDAPIARSPRDRKKMAVITGGREAATNYRTLERYPGYTYTELRLETGRTHQIRVHMSHIGHPLFCDTVYGGGKTKLEMSFASRICGQCLHARTISFLHPETGELMRFDSGLPEYMEQLLTQLRKL